MAKGVKAGEGETASGVKEEDVVGFERTDCWGLAPAGGPDCTIAGSAKVGGKGGSQTEISLMSVPRKIMYWKTSSLGWMTLSVRRFSVPKDLTKIWVTFLKFFDSGSPNNSLIRFTTYHFLT